MFRRIRKCTSANSARSNWQRAALLTRLRRDQAKTARRYMQNPHNRHGPGPREMTLDSIRSARPVCRSDRHDPRLDQLSARLPPRLRSVFQWLLRPSSTWTRIPAGTLLICGGLLGFLPILGLWMLPLGLLLLAEDVPPLRSIRTRILDWIERRHPRWLAHDHDEARDRHGSAR
jgi:hypothetical protein